MTRLRTSTPRARLLAALVLILLAAGLLHPFETEPAAAASGTGVISGIVTAPGAKPLAGIGVFLKGADDQPYTYRTHTFTDAAGRYSFGALEADRYKVLFQPQSERPTGDYVMEWWQNASSESTASVITLASGATKDAVNAELTPGASIAGRVTDQAGKPIVEAVLWVRSVSGPEYSAETDGDGVYKVVALPAGTYTLQFASPWSGPQAIYVDEWWQGASDSTTARRIKLLASEAKSGFDAELSTGSTISGRVLDLENAPLSGAFVEAQRSGGVDIYEHFAYTDGDGEYSISGLTAGAYDLTFQSKVGIGNDWSHEVWRDAPYADDATKIVLGANDNVALGDMRMGALAKRLAGPKRYETSVEISKSAFEPDVPVVYIASGENFPDALAAAPVAGLEGGPVLLTKPASLPQVVADEITRLRPAKIVVVGGAPAVDAGVLTALQKLTTGAVIRIAGARRYETAALVSASHFEPGVPVVYLANGENFPDALAGAPLAGLEEGPVLLTPPTGLSPAAEAELLRLHPAKVVVLGGTPAVGAAVIDRVSAVTSATVERLAGVNRYATAVAVSKARFASGTPVVYLASGENFPDALAAAPVALRDGAPMLLTPRGSLPSYVADELARLRPAKIIVLGGDPTISWEIQHQLSLMAARF
ncbi:cell wall-binding repeat-containing protein [Agromyces allii]|uniref:alpha-amylase n=1 Tax=Agromyces allii TaxID=393607 RepID=A0ABN2Q132_9MICO|nr:cell wall-binding repeat-containing protein [Agromyces allii]